MVPAIQVIEGAGFLLFDDGTKMRTAYKLTVTFDEAAMSASARGHIENTVEIVARASKSKNCALDMGGIAPFRIEIGDRKNTKAAIKALTRVCSMAGSDPAIEWKV